MEDTGNKTEESVTQGLNRSGIAGGSICLKGWSHAQRWSLEEGGSIFDTYAHLPSAFHDYQCVLNSARLPLRPASRSRVSCLMHGMA